MPFIVHNTVFLLWISACYFNLVSSSALPASSITFTLYKHRFKCGKKGLHGFDSDIFKVLEVNKGLSLTTENGIGKGVDVCPLHPKKSNRSHPVCTPIAV